VKPPLWSYQLRRNNEVGDGERIAQSGAVGDVPGTPGTPGCLGSHGRSIVITATLLMGPRFSPSAPRRFASVFRFPGILRNAGII
jgi:hypothetical protein